MAAQILIRQESPHEYGAVNDLIREAFASAQHSDGTEQDLAAALRLGTAFLPQLSLVAEVDGVVAGHILFTRGHVGAQEVLMLAPLSVRPKYQRQGVGSALIREGHRIAGELGFGWSLVLGSEEYYPRLGYVPAQPLGVLLPAGFPPQNFMACRLREDAGPLSGEVTYAREFGL